MMERLNEFLELHGPESLAIVGSSRMSQEGNIMAARLKEMLGAETLSYFCDENLSEQTLAAVSLLNASNSASQDDVRQADLLVITECDLLDEAPMLALAVRQAWRNGAQVYVVDDKSPIDAARPELFESVSVPTLADILLTEAKRPVFICGIDFKNHSALLQTTAGSSTKLAFIMNGPNAFGCAILAGEHGARPLSRSVTEKRIKGIIAFEADLPDDLLAGIRVLGAADWRPTGLMARAEVQLPSCAWVEQEGTFVNNEGRAQRFKQVMQPGRPIKGLTEALHPPLEHRHDAPGGDVLPAWRVMAELIRRLGGEPMSNPLEGRWAGLQGLDTELSGVLLNRFSGIV
jgi:NADH-quinone oxidoreductase subunit G